jgi:hypothetical protein
MFFSLCQPFFSFWYHFHCTVAKLYAIPSITCFVNKLFESQGTISSSYCEIYKEPKECCLQDSINDMCWCLYGLWWPYGWFNWSAGTYCHSQQCCSELYVHYSISKYLFPQMCWQLMQLFLKASQDKRFVCEAAEAALLSMTSWISPLLLLPRMQPYLKNRNPRIRAKASVCFSKSVPRLVSECLAWNLFVIVASVDSVLFSKSS